MPSHSLHDNRENKLSRKRLGQTPAAKRVEANYRAGWKAKLCQTLWDLRSQIQANLTQNQANILAASEEKNPEQKAKIEANLLTPRDFKSLSDALRSIAATSAVITGEKTKGNILELPAAEVIEDTEMTSENSPLLD